MVIYMLIYFRISYHFKCQIFDRQYFILSFSSLDADFIDLGTRVIY